MISYSIDSSLNRFFLLYIVFITEIIILVFYHSIIADTVNFWFLIILFIISAIITPIGFFKQRIHREEE